MDLPQRDHPPHDIPSWVDPQRAIYFLTIGCRKRGLNQLATSEVATSLHESALDVQRRALWFCHLFLVMPDHVHALISFPPSQRTVQAVVANWKRWTAKHLKVEWQKDFFEHRIRSQESGCAKWDYVCQNPVRAGLVKEARDWPYAWCGGAPLNFER